jgi:hypothetical protein
MPRKNILIEQTIVTVLLLGTGGLILGGLPAHPRIYPASAEKTVIHQAHPAF